jgi:hypothetical protein
MRSLSLLVVLAVSCVASGDEVDDETYYQAESLQPMRAVLVHAKNAGVSCENLPMAGAIAKAESGLDTTAKGFNGATSGCPSGSVDRGLWQINSCYHPTVSESCAFDGACNARAMVKISSNGTNWKPWSTYHNGAYKKHLAVARAAYNSGVPGCTSGGGTAPSDQCHSGTLGRYVPERTCVESKFDDAWYTCVDGEWRAGKLDCASSYPL